MWPISSPTIKVSGDGLIRLGVALALVCASLLQPISGSASSAFAEETYTSSLTGWDVHVAGPNFALDSTSLEEYPHGTGERIQFSGLDNRAVVEIAFFDDTDSPKDTIDVAMREVENTSREFELIDTGESEEGAFALGRVRLSINFSGYVYIQVTPDVEGNVDFYQSMYMLNLDFDDALALASEEITVNGNSFLHEPLIDVSAAIVSDQQAIASATPVHAEHRFTTVPSTIIADPPVSLNYDAQTDVLEFVNLSTDAGFGIVGYLSSATDDPVQVVEEIFASAPTGEEPPEQIYRAEDGEHVLAVYRIDREGGVTIMVIQVRAAGPNIWLIEAIASSETEIISDLNTWQQSVTIDGDPMLQFVSSDELDGILKQNLP